MFLGEHLTDIITSIARGIRPGLKKTQALNTGVNVLPNLRKDNNDRNRTSPLAFTGNKFEFRMLGSSQNIAFINVVLTTGLTNVFARFADRLEGCEDLETEVAHIVADTIQNHERIIFNGNNYAREWVEEAKRRGLPNLPSSLDVVDTLCEQKNIELFARHGVLSEAECRARYDVFLENFVKVVNIEAETMLHMVRRQVVPAVISHIGEVARSLLALESAGLQNPAARDHLETLNKYAQTLHQRCDILRDACHMQENVPSELRKRANYFQEVVRLRMCELRESCDALEAIVGDDKWPMPTYTDLLHRV